ncbi:MAG: hypothetical protein ABI211_06545 [Vicinamibacterales bacterium]
MHFSDERLRIALNVRDAALEAGAWTDCAVLAGEDVCETERRFFQG